VNEIKLYDFLTRTSKTVTPSEEPENDGLPGSGHGGGDFGLMQSFIFACATGNQEYVLSGPQETLGKNSGTELCNSLIEWTQSIWRFNDPLILMRLLFFPDSHIYCFAAEHARKTGTVVDIDEFKKSLPFVTPS